MKKPEINLESFPRSAISETTLKICLKCAFDFFTRQLKLTPRTAYSELKRHVPEETDFSGTTTSRPHFKDQDGVKKCPYCNAAKKWFADFRAVRIDAYAGLEKERRKLWAALKKKPDLYTLRHPERTQMQIFSEWLERLNRETDFDDERWLLRTAMHAVKRAVHTRDLDEVPVEEIRRVQLSRQLDDEWAYDNGWLYVSPVLYGDALMVQHLVSRSHAHGGRTLEGRLTLQELISRLRRIGYLEAKGITAREPYEAFEEVIVRLVDSDPVAVYYAVDRSQYLKQLKSIYEQKRTK
jgi:hypothetical protein